MVNQEHLLNRAQARTWDQFVQASQSMVIKEPSAPPVGLSDDAEELRRVGLELDLAEQMKRANSGVDEYGIFGDGTIGAD